MTRKSLEKNIKIFPFYRAFSYDFLFLWTISIMYLTWKGLSYSQTIYLDAIFMFVAFVLQIPITKLTQKIGRGTSIRIAGLCCVAFCVIYLVCDNFWWFALANAFYGISASIKNVCDAEILALSLKRLGRDKEFSKIEGKGTFWHYIYESIAAILSGYMFQYISPYAPVVGTFVCSCILVLLACLIIDPKNGELLEELQKADDEENNKELKKPILKAPATVGYNMSNYKQELKLQAQPKKRKNKKELSYRELLKDKFVLSMMVFCFCYYGIMSVYSSLAKVYYQDVGTKAFMFGYIFFGFKIVTALASKYQFKYELKRGVKSLIIFAFLTIFTFGMNGIMATINPTAVVSIVIISIMFVIQNAIRSPYRIFVKNYINISSEKENLTKVLTLYSMAEYLGYSFITIVVATVLNLTNNSFATTNLIITAIIAIPMIVSIIIFVKELIKKYAKKQTIIREDMKNDL